MLIYGQSDSSGIFRVENFIFHVYTRQLFSLGADELQLILADMICCNGAQFMNDRSSGTFFLFFFLHVLCQSISRPMNGLIIGTNCRRYLSRILT